MSTFHLNGDFEYKNSEEIAYRAYKISSAQKQCKGSLCEALFRQVRSNLDSIDNKLHLMDIINGTSDYSDEVQAKAKTLLDKLLINEDPSQKNEIMDEISNFIALTNAVKI